MTRILVPLLVWILLLLTAGQPKAMAQTEPSYETALNDYHANRIRESARALKAILLKDPRNKEAAMLLATIYYQNHKLKKAYYLFEKSDASLLNNENAFAWGSTYLESDDDKKAALGFRYLLKNKGPFRPFATYYLAVIAYKAAQWQKARKYFQKVNPEDLPVALRVNRRRYLADIKKQQEKMLESIIGGTNAKGPDLSTTQQPLEARPPKDSGNEEELEAPQKNALQVERAEDVKGWRSSFKPSLMLTQQTQLGDNHGLTHDNVNLFAHREGLSGLLNYGEERPSGGFSGGVAYAFGDMGYSAQVEEVRYIALEQTSGVFTSQVTSTQEETSGFASLQPQLSFYFNDRMRLDLNLGIRSYFPAYDYLQAWGEASQEFGARFDDGDTEAGLEIGAVQAFDEKQTQNALDLSGRAEFEQQFGEARLSVQAYGWQTDRASYLSSSRFRLVLADPELRYRTGFVSEVGAAASVLWNMFSESTLQIRAEALQREPLQGAPRNRLRSTDSVESVAYGALKSLASVNVPLGDSATLTGSAAYHVLTDYHFTDLDATGTGTLDYVTDVQQLIYQAGGVISFAEWIRLSGTYTVTTNDYTAKAAGAREFRRRNPDYTVDADFYLEIGKTF